MASKSRTLYTGITSKLHGRTYEYKNNLIEDFTSKYKTHRLVYYQSFDDVRKAINREKQIKSWTRAKRLALISSLNPTWEDLAEQWYESHPYQPDQLNAKSALLPIQQQVPRSARDDTSLEGSGMRRTSEPASNRKSQIRGNHA